MRLLFRVAIVLTAVVATLGPPLIGGARAAGDGVVLDLAQADDWVAIQRRLNALGFDAGMADGKPGARTRYAISAFQAANHRAPTGKLSPDDRELLFSDAATGAQTFAVNTGSDFELLSDTDLPFGDYRSGKEDPGLKNISVEQCLAVCQAEQQCQAFTYNVKYKFCFLKETNPEPLAFEGAISGRRLAGDEAETVLAAAGDANRYRLIGAPDGCPAQETVISRLRGAMKVEIGAAVATVGGEPLVLRWSRGEFPERLPVYLMVSTASPVRFSGRGLYALTAQGKAAFDLQQFAGTTRAVVPLYGKGVPLDGSFTIEPLAEGRLELDWDVVGMTDCGEEAANARTLVAEVVAGSPEIIFQNPFSPQSPIDRISSPDGDRTIEAFEGYYRLYDADGYLIAERPGQQPRFSPTGRFASAWTNDYVAQIIDTVDGKLLTTLGSIYAIGWDNGDSFFAAGHTAWGGSTVGSLLAGELSLSDIGASCHACTGMQDAMRFDLENNYVLLTDAARSLTVDAGESVDRTTSGESPAEFLSFARDFSQTVPLALPSETETELDWEFSYDKPLTTIASDILLFDRPSGKDEFLEANAFPVTRLPIESPLAVGAEDSETAMQVAMRGPSRIHALKSENDKQRVLDALAPLTFAPETPIERTVADLEVVEAREYSTIFEFPGFPELRVAASAFAGGCSLSDEDAEGTDGIVYDYYPTTLALQSTDRFAVVGTACAEGSAAHLNASVLVADRQQPDRLVDLALQFSRVRTSANSCAVVLGACGYGLKAFNGHHLVFWSGGSEAVAVYDGATGRLASYAAVPRAVFIQDVSLDTTGRWLVLHFGGGLFSIIDLTTVQKQDESHMIDAGDAARPVVLQGMLADGELIVWNGNLQFDATAEGAEFVSVRFAGRGDVYALTQFEGALRRKGMLAELATGAGSPQGQRSIMPPPALLKASIAGGPDTVDFDTAWSVGTLDKLTILQDGLLTDIVDVSDAPGRLALSTPRIQGSKWVTVLAQDNNGIVSRPYSTMLDPDPRGRRQVRLVAVGIDKYDDPGLPSLPLARTDAVNVEAAFGTLELVDLIAAERLTDAATDAASIRTALNAAVEASTADETLVLTLSGHGVQDAWGELYLATRDTRLDDMAKTALAWTELAGIVARAKGRVVIFLDTCHSGIAGTAYAAQSEGAVEDFLTAVPSNIVIFSASKGRESSQEKVALGGGVFTSALVKALGEDRAAADRDADGSLTIGELYAYLRLSVAGATQGEQTPWFARNKMVGEFAVF